MKKLLLMATVGLMGISAANAVDVYDIVPSIGTATPVSELTDGKMYLIYDADGGRYAFRKDNGVNANVEGTHVTPGNLSNLTAAHVWIANSATVDGVTTWTFKNYQTNSYLNQTATFTANVGYYITAKAEVADATSFTIESHGNAGKNGVNENAKAVKRSDTENSRWDGTPSYTMVGWNGTGHPYYFYEVSEANGNWTKSYIFHVNFKLEDGTLVDSSDIYVPVDATSFGVTLPEFTVTNETSVAVEEGKDTYDVTVAFNPVPFAYTTTADEPKKWQLVGQHTNQISDGHMWKYTEDDVVIATEDIAQSTATSINANFTDAHLFAFVGNLKDGFKIYNKAAGEDKTLYYTGGGGKIGVAGTNPDVWKLNICSEATNTNLYCCFSANDFSNYLNWQDNAVKSYGANDAGSGCYFYTPAAAGIKYYEANIGNSFKLNALNVSGCTELYDTAVKNPYDLDAAKALNAALVAAPTNGPLPTAGHFYRFNGCFNSYNNYLTVDANDNLTIVSGKAANGPETVFYYDGQYLVSLANGKVVGKSTGNSGDKKVFLTKNTNAASIEFKTPSADNTKCYIITISNKPEDHKNYYIAGNGAGTIAHGSLETTSEAPAAFYWTVEDVQWLPVYFGDNSTTTLFLPVGIDGNKMEGRLEARDLTVNSVKTEELVKSESPAENIEPGHGYIVKKLGSDNGHGWNASTKCIFVEVNYNKTVASQASNDLTGTIYAAEATEKHFVYNPNEDADPAFNPASDFVPGFQAHFVAPDNHNYSQYTVKDYENRTTSSISEIVADRENGSENGAKVVYDLQGRRVANASKGIFIINGVKTLVK